MRYLMLIRLDPSAAPTQGPDPAMAENVGKLLEEMTKAGVLLDTAGLRPVGEGVRVRQTSGKQSVLDGPFSESKEVIGGYCLVQTRSQDEAVEWGSRFLRVHGPEWDIELEIRQLDDQA
ncbi:transcriptional regulator [Nocardia nova]|uniref:Transcriptional regulator n=2 Tax=Nocardia nova TaxID=37330 RepID=A0A2S6ARH4_9NOCA|nr:transcriptional regulator [Nocardia nova]PPJ37804.1 transcriptional regulator [Nocardia nova]